MAILKKIWWLMSVGVFCCTSVFAVQVNIIDKKTLEFEKANSLIDEAIGVADGEGAALIVYIDGWPEVDFLTNKAVLINTDELQEANSQGKQDGSNSIKKNKPGSMCPEDFFKEGCFYRDAAHLLYENGFKLNYFCFNQILSKGLEEVRKDCVPSGTISYSALVNYYNDLQSIRGQEQKPNPICKKYMSIFAIAHKEAVNYVKVRMQREGLWPLCVQLCTCIGVSAEGLSYCTIPTDEHGQKIAETYPIVNDEIALLSKFSPLLPLPEPLLKAEDVSDYMLNELKLRLYCHYWGNHAEDALIYKILLNVNSSYVKIPGIIEIYGSEDPCFQCQVKLQWLANYLATKRGENVTIVYYSNVPFSGPCLLLYDNMVINSFTTREKGEEGKIKKFTFEEVEETEDKSETKKITFKASNDGYDHKLEAFAVPVIVDLSKEGDWQYKGEILEIISTSGKRKIFKIKITETKGTDISRYKKEDNVCISLSNESVIPEDQIITQGSPISFNFIDNKADCVQESGIIEKDSVGQKGKKKSAKMKGRK